MKIIELYFKKDKNLKSVMYNIIITDLKLYFKLAKLLIKLRITLY